MTTRHAPGNPYADDPEELLSDSEWSDGPGQPEQPVAPLADGEEAVK